MAKANAVIQVQQTEAGNILVAVAGVGSITMDMTKVHADNKAYAAFHGFKQRLVDAAALSRDTTNGATASPADKFAAIKELVDHYEGGSPDWSRQSAGGGASSITLEAIATIQGLTYEVAEERVARMADAKFGGDTRKCLAYLRTGAKVAEEIERIRKARMPAPKLDADEALAELA